MRSKKSFVGCTAVLEIVALCLLVTAAPATAQQATLLHSFGNGTDGIGPASSLTFDGAGNLYGTTNAGGTGANCGNGCGTVFELTPVAGGDWTEKVLYNFKNDGRDGWLPRTSLIFDVAGNLYGTTTYGGTHNGGTVFELSPSVKGRWTEKLLHSFYTNSTDGIYPSAGSSGAGLIFDAAGNLYGTTTYGGAFQNGTVFELTPTVGGAWSEKILHAFGRGTDAAFPQAGLVSDAAGNLYGTTLQRSVHYSGGGTVFELTPAAGGWTEKILYEFGSRGDGDYLYAGLLLDAAGNLYGTTYFGGNGGNVKKCVPSCGTVFELTPAAVGGWTKKVLYSFGDTASDGYWPTAGLIFDAAGNLYGTTGYGGSLLGGTVFELTPAASVGWTEKILNNFTYNGAGGYDPAAGLTLDAAGNIYGTSFGGGAYRGGTLFEIRP